MPGSCLTVGEAPWLCLLLKLHTQKSTPLTSSGACSASSIIGWFQVGWPFSSVQFSRSVLSDSLRPHGLQRARPPCPSPTPRAYSDSCPLSRWCHPTISSSVIPFSSRLQSFPASGSFPMSQFFTSGGQRIGSSYILLNKKSQSEKATYCVIPAIRCSGKSKTMKSAEKSGCVGGWIGRVQKIFTTVKILCVIL